MSSFINLSVREPLKKKIDNLLSSKKGLSDELLIPEKEINLTELGNTELLNIVTLDIHRVLGESS